MAHQGGKKHSGGKPQGKKPARGGSGTPARRPGGTKKTAPAKRAPRPAPREAITETTLPAGPFRLGMIPGASPGTWIDKWKQRMPTVDIELVPLTVAGQRAALDEGLVDAAIVRLPIEPAGMHIIRLYEETPVVVSSAESHLMAADTLAAADLAGETLLTPSDSVLELTLPGTLPPAYSAALSTAQAIETVATGVGIVVVPMSLARLHHRKDADFRILKDGPLSAVGLAWPQEGGGVLVDTFIGIVRGRTAHSSRGA